VRVRFTLLLLSVFFLEACVNLKYLEKEIEQNPHVKNVFIMENMSEPFGPTKIRIGRGVRLRREARERRKQEKPFEMTWWKPRETVHFSTPPQEIKHDTGIAE
jgi:hypothetical protein